MFSLAEKMKHKLNETYNMERCLDEIYTRHDSNTLCPMRITC